jgi:hypothetical protein
MRPIMASADATLRVYEALAHWYERQGQAKQRDWFLVLAADRALAAGRPDEAERLRGRLLQTNPHHLLKPFDSFAEALKSPDVEGYVADLRRLYPPDMAEQLLQEQRATGPPAGEEMPPAISAFAMGSLRGETEVPVFRLETAPEDGPAAAPPRPEPKTAAAKPPPAERPTPLRRREPSPALTPWTTSAAGPERTTTSAEEEQDAVSLWVSLVLFVLLLAGGLALAGYLLLGPLLKMGSF